SLRGRCPEELTRLLPRHSGRAQGRCGLLGAVGHAADPAHARRTEASAVLGTVLYRPLSAPKSGASSMSVRRGSASASTAAARRTLSLALPCQRLAEQRHVARPCRR